MRITNITSNGRVIPYEITHSKNESLLIVFILSTQSVHPMRVHNPEYQPPVTSGSRVTGVSMKTIGSDSFFECVISHGMTQ